MPTTLPYRANLLGNIEQALKGLQGYGIMALELIQNADDAGARTLFFDSRDDALVVGNEREFSNCGLHDAECPWLKSGDPSGHKRACNFHAIAEMASRSKLHAAEQIGRFGIGFVSVYQITDAPIVRSTGIELRLNPQTQEVVKEEIPSSGSTLFILPWASSESEVRSGLNASPTPVDVADKVVAEIDHVLKGSLLFLRHLERVELRRNGTMVVKVAIDRSAEVLKLHFEPSGIEQRWLVLTRSADDILESSKLLDRFEALQRLDRSRMVNVAVPLDPGQIEGLIYAYLPTRQTTGLPAHVNADFFPHASRQAIVLEGEQHERFWNEALLQTAGQALADSFVRIRDMLGAARFWALIEAAFLRKGDPAFKAFWSRLGEVAEKTPSVWTTEGEWRLASETSLPPEAMSAEDQTAVSDLGLPLIHPDLRRHWTVMSNIGAQQLRLSNVVAALAGGVAGRREGDGLRGLWSPIEMLIGVSADRTGLPAVLATLKSVPFLIDGDGTAISPSEARRLPLGMTAADLRRAIPARRTLSSEVLAFPHLSELVAEYLLNDLADDLAGLIKDEISATSTIGSTDAEVRAFYSLLTAFPKDRGSDRVTSVLADVPLLRTGSGFVSPKRGQLPGDFRDPVGHFQIVDTKPFVQGTMELARNLLKVDVLTFKRYVEEHLEQLLDGDITRQQYRSLLTEIVTHRGQLDEDGTLRVLSRMAFVRTRAGQFVRPRDAYFWTASLAIILGEDDAKWVDEEWLPADLGRTRDLFDRLGMPFSVAAEHIVERIAAIAEEGDLDTVVARTSPIVRHVLDRWSRFGEDDREALSSLRDIPFLTALVDGKRDEEFRYAPSQLYQAGRALGFASQVPVVEMTALR